MQPLPDRCEGGVTVYAVEVGDTRILPGETAAVTFPDGRRATVRNERVNRASSCDGCLDIPPTSFRLDVAFHD